jgi:hypothetical protein
LVGQFNGNAEQFACSLCATVWQGSGMKNGFSFENEVPKCAEIGFCWHAPS